MYFINVYLSKCVASIVIYKAEQGIYQSAVTAFSKKSHTNIYSTSQTNLRTGLLVGQHALYIFSHFLKVWVFSRCGLFIRRQGFCWCQDSARKKSGNQGFLSFPISSTIFVNWLCFRSSSASYLKFVHISKHASLILISTVSLICNNQGWRDKQQNHCTVCT